MTTLNAMRRLCGVWTGWITAMTTSSRSRLNVLRSAARSSRPSLLETTVPNFRSAGVEVAVERGDHSRVGRTIPPYNPVIPPTLPGREWDAECSLCGSKKNLGWRETDNVCFCGDCIDFGRHTDISVEEVLKGSVEILEELGGELHN